MPRSKLLTAAQGKCANHLDFERPTYGFSSGPGSPTEGNSSSTGKPSLSILITGSSGVLGRVLWQDLAAAGHCLLPYDLEPLHGNASADILDLRRLSKAALNSDGIIHLAAVSRVADGERDPSRCHRTNVDGTVNVLRAARRSPKRPWVLFVSSREVYGRAETIPLNEDHPVLPINTYGVSKARAEHEVSRARAAGLSTAVVRLTNVYGSPFDYSERVVPAFIRAVRTGSNLRIDGADCILDLVHIDDAVAGVRAAVSRLAAGEHDLPVVQLVSGVGVTLSDLARKTIDIVRCPAGLDLNAPRDKQVHRFVGNPSRAKHLLGWSARVPLDVGLRRLVHEVERRDEMRLHSASQGRAAQ